MTSRAPIAVALDAPDLDTAAEWAALVTPHVTTLKIGLELYLRYGPEVVASVRGARGVDVFLDLKLHDIPVTVEGAVRSVAKLRPDLLTVHAAAGPAAIEAAVRALPQAKIVAVTVLTSLDDADLDEIGLAGTVTEAACRLAAIAVKAGVGREITLITPGVRLPGQATNDQARVATPQQALRDGADLLVIGRPITTAADPGAAAAAIGADLRRPESPPHP